MKLTVENLKNEIVANDGLIISEATLQVDSLLSNYYQFIKDYSLSDTRMEEIRSFFTEEPTLFNCFYNNTHLFEEKKEEAEEYLNESIFYFFNEIAPDGFYFGNTEGDGACFGFFKYEEEEEDKIEDALDEIAERVRDGYKSGICGNGVTWSIEINI